jgi:GDP-mannose 6-dehydrogenase
MKISIFGLGYVGCVSAACLAREGHEVIGVDVSQSKVDMINDGKSPIVEKDLDEILKNVVSGNSKGTLSATTDAIRAVLNTELSLICVGTPSNDNGSLRLDYIKSCANDIGRGLKQKNDYHVIVARSTMLPGSVDDVIVREIEYISGKKAGDDFGVVMNPEFLRESTSIDDFYNPAVTVIGELDSRSGNKVEEMYHFLSAPFVRTEIKVAEMIKYANNTFHALKVTFGNEIGLLAKAIGIDSHKVMEIFCMDDKLNLSPYYLKPGFAFGGSCLPKDLRALTYKGRELDIETPLLSSIIPSNRSHIEAAVKHIVRSGKKRIGILGLSFKAGTDDLRESPLVILTERLLGKGFQIKIYDRNVAIAKIFGANKEYIEREIPHISSLMRGDIKEVTQDAEIIILGNKSEEFKEVVTEASPEQRIYDLVRISSDIYDVPAGYEGICW